MDLPLLFCRIDDHHHRLPPPLLPHLQGLLHQAIPATSGLGLPAAGQLQTVCRAHAGRPSAACRLTPGAPRALPAEHEPAG